MGDAGDGEASGARRGRRWPPRPLVLAAAGVAAGVVLIGAIALAAREDDGGSEPAARPGADGMQDEPERSPSTGPDTTTTSTTVAPTTTAAPVAELAATTAPPASRPPASTPSGAQAPPPRQARCFRPWLPPTPPLPTVPAPPDKFVSFGPPAAGCVDVAEGCLVSFVLRWSDGFAEVGSLVLAVPGSYTVSGDRGTNWNFAVHDDLTCTANGGTWENVWPPGT